MWIWKLRGLNKKEHKNLIKEIERVNKNAKQRFLEKAPKEVVDKERAKTRFYRK